MVRLLPEALPFAVVLLEEELPVFPFALEEEFLLPRGRSGIRPDSETFRTASGREDLEAEARLRPVPDAPKEEAATLLLLLLFVLRSFSLKISPASHCVSESGDVSFDSLTVSQKIRPLTHSFPSVTS